MNRVSTFNGFYGYLKSRLNRPNTNNEGQLSGQFHQGQEQTESRESIGANRFFPAWQVLGIANEIGTMDTISMLKKSAETVNLPDKGGRTPLFIAARNGNIEIVRELLELNATINTPDKDGRTPLFIAAQNGHTNVVHLLAKKGALINKCCKLGVTSVWIMPKMDT